MNEFPSAEDEPTNGEQDDQHYIPPHGSLDPTSGLLPGDNKPDQPAANPYTRDDERFRLSELQSSLNEAEDDRQQLQIVERLIREGRTLRDRLPSGFGVEDFAQYETTPDEDRVAASTMQLFVDVAHHQHEAYTEKKGIVEGGEVITSPVLYLTHDGANGRVDFEVSPTEIVATFTAAETRAVSAVRYYFSNEAITDATGPGVLLRDTTDYSLLRENMPPRGSVPTSEWEALYAQKRAELKLAADEVRGPDTRDTSPCFAEVEYVCEALAYAAPARATMGDLQQVEMNRAKSTHKPSIEESRDAGKNFGENVTRIIDGTQGIEGVDGELVERVDGSRQIIEIGRRMSKYEGVVNITISADSPGRESRDLTDPTVVIYSHWRIPQARGNFVYAEWSSAYYIKPETGALHATFTQTWANEEGITTLSRMDDTAVDGAEEGLLRRLLRAPF